MFGQRARRATGRRVAHCCIALLAALAACAGDDVPAAPDVGTGPCPSDLPSDTDCPGAAPSYTGVVAGVVEGRCQGCHYARNPFSSQVFEDYSGLFAARRTALSQVYGCRMPPADAPQLSAQERAQLLQWFVCGAPEN